VVGTQAVAGDCAQSCTVEGQWKGLIHCNGDPQDHEDWDTTGLWPTIGDPRSDIVKSDDASSKWDTLINAPTRWDFDRLATQPIPRELIVNHPSIEAHKNRVYGQARMNDIVPYEEVNIRSYRDIPIINRHFDRFVYNRPDDRQRCPSICLIGRSGLAMTEYVRRLGDHVNFDGEVSSKRMNSNAGFMVFDDVPFDRYEGVGCWTQYYGCQKTLGLCDLHYRGQLTWGRHCIFLCNADEDPRLVGQYDLSYLAHNCIFEDIDESMYLNRDGTLDEVYTPSASVPPVPACGIDLDFLTEWIFFFFFFFFFLKKLGFFY